MISLRSLTVLGFSAALLSACNSATPPKPAPTPEVTPVLSGQLVGIGNTTASLSGNSKTLAVTSVDAGGNFTLTLPTSAQLSGDKTSLTAGLLADLGCTGVLTLGDPSAKGYAFATLTAGNGKEYADATVTKTLTTRTLKGRAYLYADKATTLEGPLNCSAATGYPTTVQVSIDALAGWNTLAINITGSLGFGGISVGGTVGNGAALPGSLWTDVDSLRAQLAP
ncbi:hypothetical protein EHF33_01835 [Deinococcus psychrotolerans]|uniref:Lipoprotein n=1 Tax=Deinococcus psychrotolerans TaxID=2489213 RepID=A0A3G8YBR5_9DEIO|nr:hypothetical protein [Deinococcus psychrotolerans]AZI41647.1 hypothetical protein EHF33_01835 [Deinococcus psychrotolerans]